MPGPETIPAATATAPELPRALRQTFLAAVGLLFLLTVAFHLAVAAKGWRTYREQHVGTALEYARGGIDLLHPVVVGFNANNTPTPQELPLWQATAAVFFKGFGRWLGWANVASLLFAFTNLWPVFQLARAHAGERIAWWTLLFFLSQPLVFYMSGRGGTDGSCLTLMVWFVYFADLLVRTGQWRWLVPATVLGALSAVTKAPLFFCAGLVSFFLLLQHGRRVPARWIMLAVVGVIALLAFKLWTHHTDAQVARAEFPLVDLRVNGGKEGGKFMQNWYFGDLKYRLNPANWIKGGWRVFNTQFGSFVLVGCFAWGLLRSGNRLGQFWVLAGFLTTLVFTHLVLHHSHYYLMISPAVALLCASAAARMELALTGDGVARPGLIVVMTVPLLLLSTLQGLVGMKVTLDADPYPGRMAAIIREKTAPDDKLVIQGGGWGGHLLFLAERRGLSVWDTALLEEPGQMARLKSLGFTKLVMVSSSPLLLAMQQTNPGQSTQARDTYHRHLTAVPNAWPTVLETEDILIKQIP